MSLAAAFFKTNNRLLRNAYARPHTTLHTSLQYIRYGFIWSNEICHYQVGFEVEISCQCIRLMDGHQANMFIGKNCVNI